MIKSSSIEPLILDVRSTSNEADSSGSIQAIVQGLSKPKHHRTLPTSLVYDERGLKLYEDITTKAPEYYPYPCERQILTDHAKEIVRIMRVGTQPDEVIVELGAGPLWKTSNLLLALAEAIKSKKRLPVSYFALDLERPELVRTLRELTEEVGSRLVGHVRLGGMWGTYDDGIVFVKRGALQEQPARDATPLVRRKSSNTSDTIQTSPTRKPTPIHFLFFGTSLGNFTRQEAAEFLRSLSLRPGSGDTLLLGIDRRNDPDLIRLAYDDPRGCVKAFALNGLVHASKILGGAIDIENWSYVRRYDEILGRHEAYFRSDVDQTVKLSESPAHPHGEVVRFDKGELVNLLYSYKYSDADAAELFAVANLRVMHRWLDSKKMFSLWLLERASSGL